MFDRKRLTHAGRGRSDEHHFYLWSLMVTHFVADQGYHHPVYQPSKRACRLLARLGPGAGSAFRDAIGVNVLQNSR